MTLFTDGPDGMTGNDDLGTMSAWYVFSSLGLYPTTNGGDFLAVSSPQFPSAVIRIGDHGKQQGGTLTVKAPGTSDTQRYVRQAKFGGKNLSATWLDWDAVAKGGNLAFEMAGRPSTWGTGKGAEPPSVNRAAADARRHLDASLRTASDVLPTADSAQSVRLQMDVLGQSPGTLRVDVAAKAPSGWTAKTAAPFSLTSDRLPVQRTAAVDVTVPANTAPGSYTVRVTASAKGVKPVERLATIEVRTAARCAEGAGEVCAVDLRKEVNHDGTATVAASGEGDFDGGGWSFDGDLLPAAGPVVWDGVTYDAPDPSGTALNFVEARGQAMLLPAGSYGALRLVAVAHHGPATTALTVRYTDGSTAEVPVTVGDWAGSTPQGSSVVLEMPHRIKHGQGVDGPPVRLFGASAGLDASKTVRSVGLPNDPRVQIYAVTLK